MALCKCESASNNLLHDVHILPMHWDQHRHVLTILYSRECFFRECESEWSCCQFLFFLPYVEILAHFCDPCLMASMPISHIVEFFLLVLLPGSGQSDEAIAVGFGYAAHLVYLTALFLHLPLRYAISPRGSRSVLKDDISDASVLLENKGA